MSYLSLTPEHIEAANKIVVSFTTGRWSILIAQMQSGKTFTFLLACAEMIRNNMISFFLLFSIIIWNQLRIILVDFIN